MELIEAILLGILQGLTEFLPVSSSGHLEIAQHLLGLELLPGAALTFSVVVHSATVMATITVFFSELKQLFRGGLKFEYNKETQYILKIVLSMLPILVMGLFFKENVEGLFGQGIRPVGIMLLVTATLLLFTYFVRPKKRRPIGYKDAFIIGLSQAAAIFPGLSRSGTTIATGLMIGNERKEIAKFSFLMVLVPILGEALLELIGGKFTPEASGVSTITLLAGFAAAYVAGVFACRVMIRIVSQGKLYWFAVYCTLAGVAAIIWG